MSKPSASQYAQAGVDIDKGNQLVEAIKPLAQATRRAEVLAGLGGFGALFELPSGYTAPVLVSATDGVGTKLKLALELKQHRTVGIDLVAMCANDLIVSGAEPLFFLDYYATGQLDVPVATDVIAGIAEGCKQAGMALVGGETAEMPGLYQGGDYDLAGFCVGVVEKSQIIDGSRVQAGDALIGLGASGAHSNGYSLIRHLLTQHSINLSQPFNGSPIGEQLLAPTRIYVKAVRQLMQRVPLHALAHITGGGLIENIPRVLPPHLMARIDIHSWQRPELFRWLAELGQIEDDEMRRTFNCGVGMVLCVAQDQCEAAIALLQQAGEQAWRMGEVSLRGRAEPAIELG